MAKLIDKAINFLQGGTDEDDWDDEDQDGYYEDDYYDHRDARQPRKPRFSEPHYHGREGRESGFGDGGYGSRSSRHESSRYESSRYEDDGYFDDDLTDLPPRRDRNRRTSTSNVVDFGTKRDLQILSEIIIICPKEIQDAASVCEHLRENKTCIINMQDTERIQAQRIADYLGGASYTLNGNIERIDSHMFVIAPHSVKLTTDIREELKSGKLLKAFK